MIPNHSPDEECPSPSSEEYGPAPSTTPPYLKNVAFFRSFADSFETKGCAARVSAAVADAVAAEANTIRPPLGHEPKSMTWGRSSDSVSFQVFAVGAAVES